MRLGKFRFQLDGLIEALDCFRQPVERVEHDTVVEPKLRRRRPRFHRGRDQAQRLGGVALRQLHQTAHMQRVEIIWANRQDRRVKFVRLSQLPRPVKFERLRMGLWDVERFSGWQRR